MIRSEASQDSGCVNLCVNLRFRAVAIQLITQQSFQINFISILEACHILFSPQAQTTWQQTYLIVSSEKFFMEEKNMNTTDTKHGIDVGCPLKVNPTLVVSEAKNSGAGGVQWGHGEQLSVGC